MSTLSPRVELNSRCQEALCIQLQAAPSPVSCEKEVTRVQLATEIHSIQVAKWVGFLLCFPPLEIQIAGSTKQVYQTNTYTLLPPRRVSNLHFLGIANTHLCHTKITPKSIFY